MASMCRVLKVQRSGFYAWLKTPRSARAVEDARLLAFIRQAYQASDGIYGSPRILSDLREAGETCGRHRCGNTGFVPAHPETTAFSEL